MEQNILSTMRSKYFKKSDLFLEENIKVKDPIILFNEWLEKAISNKEIAEPNAACLATVNIDGFPSNRYVLIKQVSSAGFTFFTNYNSRKASDISINPKVALTFYWFLFHRSVRIEGTAEKIPIEESLEYFQSRPRNNQISALVSPQSNLVPSREYLDLLENEIINKLKPDDKIPMPSWGGYLIRPHSIEFWQGQNDRLHDRIRFRRKSMLNMEMDYKIMHEGENGWIYERLAP